MTEPANQRTDELCPAWDATTLKGCNKKRGHKRAHRYRVDLRSTPDQTNNSG